MNLYHCCLISNIDVFRKLCTDTTKETHSVFLHGEMLPFTPTTVDCSGPGNKYPYKDLLPRSMTIILLMLLLAISVIISVTQGPYSQQMKLCIQIWTLQVHIKADLTLYFFCVLLTHLLFWTQRGLVLQPRWMGCVSFCLSWTQWGKRTPGCSTHSIDAQHFQHGLF